METDNNRVIIWGADNYHALGVIRALAEHNLDVFFLVDGKCRRVATASKYCTKYAVCTDLQGGYSYLMAIADSARKAVLVPMGDGPAEYIDKHREELLNFYYVSGTVQSGLLSRIDDKNVMADWAVKHGFNVPLTRKISRETSVESLQVNYPCLIKPARATGLVEFKTRIIRSPKELASAVKLFGKENTYTLQPYIQKEEDLLVYGCRLNSGRVVLAGTFHKTRWSDDGGGSYGYLVPEIMETCNPLGIESFLEEIEYYGLFSFEYGLQNGTAWFFEVNLRNDGTTQFFLGSGANLPLLWVNDCLGRKTENISTQVVARCRVMNEILDKINIWGKVSRKEWKTQRREADIFYYYDPNDMRPYKIAARRAWLDRLLRAFLLRWRPRVVFLIRKLKGGR